MYKRQLLQSRWISKAEFEDFHRNIGKKIVTKRDASIVITYLLATLRFRKEFWSKYRKAKARCCICGKRDDLIRYAELPDLKAVYYCKTCDYELDEARKDEILHPSSVTETEEQGK